MLAILAALPVLGACFSHSDIELFKLRNAIVADLGEDATFYSWLGVKNSAGNRDIVSAFRKISRRLHPDRNPGQEATERFARLNSVYKILRSPMREQYDGYLRSGFPLFNEATGEWHYRRFRPNLVLAVILFALLFTVVEFFARKVSASRQRTRINLIIQDAQDVAKKNSRTAGIITRSTKVDVGKATLTVEPTGDVYFRGAKLTADDIAEPTWKSTFLGARIAKLLGKSEPQLEAQEFEEYDLVEEVPEEESKKPVEPLKKGAARRRPAAARGKAKVF